MIKKIEHFWKGLSHDRTQISALPPDQYGDRFLNFMEGITVSKEEAERQAQEKERQAIEAAAETEKQRVPSWNSIGRRSTSNNYPSAPTHQPPAPPGRASGAKSPETEETMRRAEKMASKSEKHGHTEQTVPDRTLQTTGSALTGILPSVANATAPSLAGSNPQGPIGRDSTTNPILETVEETGEGSTNGCQSRISSLNNGSEGRPLTPAKDGPESFGNPTLSHIYEAPSRAPPTPPKTAGGLPSNGNGTTNGLGLGKRLTKPESADSGIGVELSRARSGSQKQGVRGQLSRDSLEKALPPLPMPVPSGHALPPRPVADGHA